MCILGAQTAGTSVSVSMLYSFIFCQLTLSSNIDIAIPEAAPDPAKPIKCPDPILLANSEAPT